MTPFARRALAVAASVTVGLIGSVALASPANATRTSVSDNHRCDRATGEWVVDWAVRSQDTHEAARRHELVEVAVEPAGSTVSDLPVNIRQRLDEPFTIEQRLPGTEAAATLSVRGKWYLSHSGQWYAFVEREPRSRTINFDGPCRKHQPEPVQVDANSTCNGLVLTLTNPRGGDEVTAKVTPSVGDQQEVPLAADQSVALSFPGLEDFTVTVEAGELTETYAWLPGDCTPPEPGEVEVTAESTCDELSVTLTNPVDGIDVTATVTPSVGGPQRVTLPVGETVAVTIPGAEGLTVDVVADEQEWVLAWVPGDCAVDIPIGFASDCETLTIEVTNPQVAGALEATFASGEEIQTVAVAPLETTEMVYAATEGTAASVTAGVETVDAIWERPEDCDDGGLGGDLPLTSSFTSGTTAGIIVGALALLGLGGALFLGASRHSSRTGIRGPRHRRPA